jgi:hypothetical protein
MSLLGAQARRLRVALAEAPDMAVGRVVAMLDALEDRGAVDALLDSVRPRLQRLRPPRPLGVARLLFLPLEGALVAAADWRGAPAELPRSAAQPIWRAVRAGIGPLVAEIEATATGHTMENHALVAALGARLWPAAGDLPLTRTPPGWQEAGLSQDAAAPLLALCGAVWRHAPLLWQARCAAAEGPPEALLRAALSPLASEGPAPLAAGMVLLLREASAPATVAAVAASLAPGLGTVAERELAALLARDAGAIRTAGTPAEMAEAAARLSKRLENLETAAGAGQREPRRQQAAMLRSDTGAACHARFAEALVAALLMPAAQAAAGPPADDHVVAALERSARDLRRLEASGRRLGNENEFDRTLRDALRRLAALAAVPGGGLARVELARLAEILAGPEAALPLLGGSAPQ